MESKQTLYKARGEGGRERELSLMGNVFFALKEQFMRYNEMFHWSERW